MFYCQDREGVELGERGGGNGEDFEGVGLTGSEKIGSVTCAAPNLDTFCRGFRPSWQF